MRVFRSALPEEVGGVDSDWRTQLPLHSRLYGTVEVSENGESLLEVKYESDKGIATLEEAKFPTGALEAVRIIDEHYRGSNTISEHVPTTHRLEIRTGSKTITALRDLAIDSFLDTGQIPKGWRRRYRQGPAHIGADSFDPSYVLSSEPGTKFFDGTYVVPRFSTETKIGLAKAIGSVFLIGIQSNMFGYCYGQEDHVYLFDESRTVHSSPQVRLKYSPSRAFLKDTVTASPVYPM